MDFDALLNKTKDMTNEFVEKYCIVNNSIMNLDTIERMGYDEFSLQAKQKMPLKLYKYFPNTEIVKDGQINNYSIQALLNNTVYMQTPLEYDDVYDSELNVDWYEYERLRLKYYCECCGVDVFSSDTANDIGDKLVMFLWEHYNKCMSFYDAFQTEKMSEMQRKSIELFVYRLLNEVNKDGNLSRALYDVIVTEYSYCMERLKTVFRATCFTTVPNSQLMWSSYADCHRGFCVEYTIDSSCKKLRDLYLNLFPMIYCKIRTDVTEKIINFSDKEISLDTLWTIYCTGALRKSIDWVYQNEWRLLMVMDSRVEDHNVEFFPITKVFLGNRMPAGKRKEIIEICNSKNIPYVGVQRNRKYFEMQECELKCEDCPKYLSDLEKK